MKKILTLALAAMVACASFAQSPLKANVKADKATTAVVKKSIAKDAKGMTVEKAQAKQAAMAAKAEAAKMQNATVKAERIAKNNAAGLNKADGLVTIPETAEVHDCYMNADNYAGGVVSNKQIKLAFDGDDVYVGGMFAAFPDVWFKGTTEGTTVTFEVPQDLGVAYDYDIYLYGVEYDAAGTGVLTTLTAELDKDAKKVVFNEDIVANAAQDRIYYLEFYQNVVLSKDEKPLTGDPIDTLPWNVTFNSAAAFAPFGVIDANGDGSSWAYNDNYNAYYAYNSYNDADDYLVSPAVYLEAGKTYTITTEAAAYSSSYAPERFEVVMGKEPKVESMTTVVIEPTELYSTEFDIYDGEVTVAESGYYHFAIHAISDADMFYLLVKKFGVGFGPDPKSPEAVSDLRVVPGEYGQKRATLYFTTPYLCVDGSALPTEKLNVKIYHNDVLAKTIEAYPGIQKTVLDDEFTTSGMTKFTVICEHDGLAGKKASAATWIGYDYPALATNFIAAAAGDHISCSWDKIGDVGVNGGYVDPSKTAYQIWDCYDLIPGWGLYVLNSQLSEDLYNVDSYDLPYDCNAGVQGQLILGLLTVNEAGESNGYPMAACYVGAPDAIPAHESFEGGAVHYNWFISDYSGMNLISAGFVQEGSIDVYAIEVNAEDGDVIGGLISSKFNMAGAENATVTADLYTTAEGTTAALYAEVDGELTQVGEPVALTDEWAAYKWNVQDYVDATAVRFHILFNYVESGSVFFDNFNVLDLYADNLVATISAAKSVVAGQSTNVKVNVQNLGENKAEGYVVKVYADDEELATISETTPLNFYETASYGAELKTTIFDEPKAVTLKAVVEYAPELAEADNTDETTIDIVEPAYAKVENLTVTKAADGLKIDWTVAEAAYEETTEDFESYDEFAYVQDGEKLGDWTGWDVDGGEMYGWNGGNWPHMGETGAFGIYNPTAIGFDPVDLPSGLQTALFMSVVPSSGTGNGNDDWMVSPELPGIAQTVKFMVSELTDQYGDEQFEVLVSTTGNTPDCFEKVLDAQASVNWEEVSVNLPEGAKYFAIRYISNDVFGLLIDDVKYTVGAGEADSFNIYLDGEKVANTAENTYTYAEPMTVGDHTVAVTAVYGVNESAPVTANFTVDVDATGIQNITTDSAKEIYTVNGVRVSEAKKAGVYVVNGQKVIIK